MDLSDDRPLNDIPARILATGAPAFDAKGHLGVGADADIAIIDIDEAEARSAPSPVKTAAGVGAPARQRTAARRELSERHNSDRRRPADSVDRRTDKGERHTMRRLLLGAFLAVLLPLSACTGGGLGDAQRGTGNSFIVAWNAQPPTLDPLMTTSTATRDISRNFFEPLITIDADNQVKPVLAESFSLSKDGTLVSFTLRKNVRFHDGSIMEAEDVVLLTQGMDSQGLRREEFEATVSSPASDKVEIKLPDPNSFVALPLLADQGQLPAIQPKEILEAAGDDPVAEFVGTGPYTMEKWNTDQYVQMARFDDYVSPTGEANGTAGQRKAAFDSMFFDFVNDPSTRMSGLQTGEYDAANALPPDNLEMLEDDENINLTTGDNGFQRSDLQQEDRGDVRSTCAELSWLATNIDDIQKAASPRAEALRQDEWRPHACVLRVVFGKEGLDSYNHPNPKRAEALLDKAGYNGEEVRILTSREY